MSGYPRTGRPLVHLFDSSRSFINRPFINPCRRIICILGLALLALIPANAQSIADYTEFHRMLRINALEGLILCHPTSAPAEEPFCYGVLRDQKGRPSQITRFMFGNLDTRSDWTTMRISYLGLDTINSVIQRRTFFDASGMPVELVEGIFTEELLHRSDGRLVLWKLMDRSGKPVNDTAGISRATFREYAPGVVMQEWYYNNGKHHFGSVAPMRPFAPVTQESYYRLFVANEKGELVREEVWNFDKKPTPFPGGEMVRIYETDDCGQPTKVTFLNTDGEPMADNDGVAYKTFDYDDSGRLIAWKAFGLNGSPRGRSGDGVAAMRYTFRAFDGVLMREEKFDVKGNPLP